jgi:hypothetical protein
MESIIDDIDIDKPLPSIIAIKCAENHLYRIGLSLFSFGSQTRNGFHNPFFISFIICVQMLKSITAILMKEDKYRLLLIGDYAYFLNGRYFMNLAIILGGFWALCSQLLYYWKYFNIIWSQMTYFYIICLYLKLKLRNANNSIRKSFDRKYKMTNYKMKNILKSIFITMIFGPSI